MRCKNGFLFMLGVGILIPVIACCESFLKATSFPTTFDDLSFAERVEVKTEGYEPFAELSAYDIFTILETDAGIPDEIAAEETPVPPSSETPVNPQPPQPPQPGTPTPPQNPTQTPPQTINPPASTGGNGGYCSIKNSEIQDNQQNPVGKPVFEHDYKFCSRYGYRKIYGKNDPHHGFDIGCTEANFGNPVFAIANGVVEKVHKCSKGSSAGNYILINHKNGFKTYYMHLDKMFVTAGQQVTAGCKIAEVGYTGGAKANQAAFANEMCPKMRKSISHLHYEIHYSGNQTSITQNGQTFPIKHGFPGKSSIDPSYFMGVSQHMQ
ncbi:MAG: M23 family metallopeptidase [Alphaproteobacteria bacterium]|nr:M23 family metallopeptidase [Alphaproteobacteria bacterium]